MIGRMEGSYLYIGLYLQGSRGLVSSKLLSCNVVFLRYSVVDNQGCLVEGFVFRVNAHAQQEEDGRGIQMCVRRPLELTSQLGRGKERKIEKKKKNLCYWDKVHVFLKIVVSQRLIHLQSTPGQGQWNITDITMKLQDTGSYSQCVMTVLLFPTTLLVILVDKIHFKKRSFKI